MTLELINLFIKWVCFVISSETFEEELNTVKILWICSFVIQKLTSCQNGVASNIGNKNIGVQQQIGKRNWRTLMQLRCCQINCPCCNLPKATYKIDWNNFQAAIVLLTHEGNGEVLRAWKMTNTEPIFRNGKKKGSWIAEKSS